jgi:glutamate dehydrogenase
VYVPRDRFDTALRQRIQQRLAAAHRGSVSAFYTHVGDDALARIHVIVKTPHDGGEAIDYVALERRLAQEARSWQDRLEVALQHEYGEERGARAFRRYRNAFPGGYVEANDALTAAGDTHFVDAVLESRKLRKRRIAHPARKKSIETCEKNEKQSKELFPPINIARIALVELESGISLG